MQDIVHQLGELFLQATPTVLIVLAFYLVLRVLFFKPLLLVMAERESRTAGARKAAEAAQAAATEKVRQYQAALQKARAQVYAEQETARKNLLDERAVQLKEARNAAGKEVSAAKQRIANELEAAKGDLQAGAGQLAAEIARRVLQTPQFPGSPVRDAR
jgi:F-type H+-transporting ATPase subunit b